MFEEIEKYAKEYHVPIIRKESGILLQEYVKKHNAQNILEIGTAIGYSAILMLSSCSGKITTIDKDEKRLEIAKKNFSKFHVEDRVRIICEDAKTALNTLCEKNEKFDFVFLDGPKGQYYNYFFFIKKLLKPNGILFVDNIFLNGLVLSQQPIPHKHRSMVVNMRKFLDALKNDRNFNVEIVNIEDGIAVATFNGDVH